MSGSSRLSGPAPVGGSPYDITASNATGGTFTAGNYTITYVNGELMVFTNTTESTALTTAAMQAGEASTFAAAGLTAGGLDLNALPATGAGSESLEEPDMVISPHLRVKRCGVNLPFACAP